MMPKDRAAATLWQGLLFLALRRKRGEKNAQNGAMRDGEILD